jgi:hypothetical protein
VRCLAAISIACILPTAVQGAANPVDAQAIAACLKAAGEKESPGIACIGIVADPCIARAKTKNSYIEDSRACAARELAVWRARMAHALQGARKVSGKAKVSALAASQKSFADSLARLCPLFDNLDPGMSLGGEAYCRLHHTAVRTPALERLSDAVNPH